jgi:hypothetical protein
VGSPTDELIEALTEAGLTWGRATGAGHPEVRVKGASGREYSVRVLRFSYTVIPRQEHAVAQQCLSIARVVELVRS